METLVINLDRRRDRWEAFQESIAELNIPYTRISAVDGRAIDKPKHHLSPWMHLTHEPGKFNIRSTVGCFLSHRKCWQHVVANGLEHALVLEDDATPTPASGAFLQAFKRGPAGLDWIKLHVNRHPDRRDRQVDLNFSIAGNELCVDLSGSKSNNAYIISGAGARKALGMTRLLAPIDHVEWLHATQGLVFAQTRSNVFEPGNLYSSDITETPRASLWRLPATARIRLVRATAGRQILRSNLRKARQKVAAQTRTLHDSDDLVALARGSFTGEP
jgi:GR25 family glycosyltransferase involved in LPS biosynthesis